MPPHLHYLPSSTTYYLTCPPLFGEDTQGGPYPTLTRPCLVPLPLHGTLPLPSYLQGGEGGGPPVFLLEGGRTLPQEETCTFPGGGQRLDLCLPGLPTTSPYRPCLFTTPSPLPSTLPCGSGCNAPLLPIPTFAPPRSPLPPLYCTLWPLYPTTCSVFACGVPSTFYVPALHLSFWDDWFLPLPHLLPLPHPEPLCPLPPALLLKHPTPHTCLPSLVRCVPHPLLLHSPFSPCVTVPSPTTFYLTWEFLPPYTL